MSGFSTLNYKKIHDCQILGLVYAKFPKKCASKIEDISCIVQAESLSWSKTHVWTWNDNEHDRFVVAGQTILPGTLFPSTKSN